MDKLARLVACLALAEEAIAVKVFGIWVHLWIPQVCDVNEQVRAPREGATIREGRVFEDGTFDNG